MRPQIPPDSQSGLSITFALICTLIVGITISASFSMISSQINDVKELRRQLTAMNLKHFIVQAIRNHNNCKCHLTQDSTIKDALGINLGPFTIDTTITGHQTSPDINLGSLRSGCDFRNTYNWTHLM